MSERDLGKIVAAHIRADDFSDVANTRHLDPLRPPPIVLQELDHLHQEQTIQDPELAEAMTGHDVFDQVKVGPWADETGYGQVAVRGAGGGGGKSNWGRRGCKYIGCNARFYTLWEREEHERGCKYAPKPEPFQEATLKPIIDRCEEIVLHHVIEEQPNEGVHDQLVRLETEDRQHAEARRRAQEALARMDAHLPPSAAERKGIPLATGCLDYFPDALAAVARLSKIGNDQHNPGEPLHWAREKSTDEPDCLMRHFLDRGTFDNDGVRHSVKVAWRALALLQREIEAAKGKLEPVFK